MPDRKETHIAVETTRPDGVRVYRFVEGTSRASVRFANQLADTFAKKNPSVTTFAITADERAELIAQMRREKAAAGPTD